MTLIFLLVYLITIFTAGRWSVRLVDLEKVVTKKECIKIMIWLITFLISQIGVMDAVFHYLVFHQ